MMTSKKKQKRKKTRTAVENRCRCQHRRNRFNEGARRDSLRHRLLLRRPRDSSRALFLFLSVFYSSAFYYSPTSFFLHSVCRVSHTLTIDFIFFFLEFSALLSECTSLIVDVHTYQVSAMATTTTTTTRIKATTTSLSKLVETRYKNVFMSKPVISDNCLNRLQFTSVVVRWCIVAYYLVSKSLKFVKQFLHDISYIIFFAHCCFLCSLKRLDKMCLLQIFYIYVTQTISKIYLILCT